MAIYLYLLQLIKCMYSISKDQSPRWRFESTFFLLLLLPPQISNSIFDHISDLLQKRHLANVIHKSQQAVVDTFSKLQCARLLAIAREDRPQFIIHSYIQSVYSVTRTVAAAVAWRKYSKGQLKEFLFMRKIIIYISLTFVLCFETLWRTRVAIHPSLTK